MPYWFAEERTRRPTVGQNVSVVGGKRCGKLRVSLPSVPHLEWGWALSPRCDPWLLSLGPWPRLGYRWGLCGPGGGSPSPAGSELCRPLLLLPEIGLRKC